MYNLPSTTKIKSIQLEIYLKNIKVVVSENIAIKLKTIFNKISSQHKK